MPENSLARLAVLACLANLSPLSTRRYRRIFREVHALGLHHSELARAILSQIVTSRTFMRIKSEDTRDALRLAYSFPSSRLMVQV
jgi:hypothetical protein